MKKFLLMFAILTSFISGSVYADNQMEPQDSQLWSVLYEGNWSLAHKMILTRQRQGLDDSVMTYFMMAYAHYRSGNHEDAIKSLEQVDHFVEKFCLPFSN